MNDQIFQMLSLSPGPFWILILFFPFNKRAMLAVDVYLLLLAGSFTLMTLPIVPELLPLIAKPEFSSMYDFLSTPKGVLGSWNHMILGDLWIGRWVARDCQRESHRIIVRIIFVIPILFFGPLGLFLYLLYRLIRHRKLSLCDDGQSAN